jgi:hypothetical protein
MQHHEKKMRVLIVSWHYGSMTNINRVISKSSSKSIKTICTTTHSPSKQDKYKSFDKILYVHETISYNRRRRWWWGWFKSKNTVHDNGDQHKHFMEWYDHEHDVPILFVDIQKPCQCKINTFLDINLSFDVPTKKRSTNKEPKPKKDDYHDKALLIFLRKYVT